MSFEELKIPYTISTDSEWDFRKFFKNVLPKTKYYYRSSGFFDSKVLIEFEKEIEDIILSNGKIKLIISPRLSNIDHTIIKTKEELERSLINEEQIKKIIESYTDEDKKRFNYFLHLLINKYIEIKFAVKESNNMLAMYHEKVAIFEDEKGNKIATCGSNNATMNGLMDNYESADVFTTFSKEGNERINEKFKKFNEIWNGENKVISTYTIPNVISEKIIEKFYNSEKAINYEKYIKENGTFYSKDHEDNQENIQLREEDEEYGAMFIPKIPDYIKLREYQNRAINEWISNDYNGIFNMATGTGKTLTAIGAMTRLYENLGKKIFIVLCPYVHLVEQWAEDLNKFNFEVIKVHGGVEWKNIFENVITGYKYIKNVPCIVTTISSFRNKYFQDKIRNNLEDIVLVADEAHNLAASKMRNLLFEEYKYRLALSATIKIHNDAEATEFLYNYFKKECINYPLSQAINEDMLTPYYYYPIPVYLDEEELNDYQAITKQLGRCYITINGRRELSEAGKILLLKRARLIAGIKNKEEVLIELIKEIPPKQRKNMIIYCGATTYGDAQYVDYYDSDEEKTDDNETTIRFTRQIEHIILRLRDEFDENIEINPFTSQEDMDTRKDIIKRFEEESLHAIAAIKCLDEGVNIPSIDKAFILASCTNPKEYIQRKGRVLRKYKGKSYATIYDFVALPRPLNDAYGQTYDELKADIGLIKREKERIYNFAVDCINMNDSYELLTEIDNVYGQIIRDCEGEYDE